MRSRRGDTFTMSSSNLTCDACPTDYALCDYDGKSDESVPVGAVAAPLDGYWHSSPYSPQFHACPVPAACSGDSWRNSRTELVQYQKDLVYGNRTLNLTEYSLLQCQEGYWGERACVGALCSSQRASATGRCSPRRLPRRHWLQATCAEHAWRATGARPPAPASL